MSEATMVNFCMDKDLKKSVPVEMSADPFYCASNMNHLAQVVAEIDRGVVPLSEHELLED